MFICFYLFQPDGKLFHDPLAVCAAIDPSLMEWCEVEVSGPT